MRSAQRPCGPAASVCTERTGASSCGGRARQRTGGLSTALAAAVAALTLASMAALRFMISASTRSMAPVLLSGRPAPPQASQPRPRVCTPQAQRRVAAVGRLMRSMRRTCPLP
jgi:hypothetical protein